MAVAASESGLLNSVRCMESLRWAQEGNLTASRIWKGR